MAGKASRRNTVGNALGDMTADTHIVSNVGTSHTGIFNEGIMEVQNASDTATPDQYVSSEGGMISGQLSLPSYAYTTGSVYQINSSTKTLDIGEDAAYTSRWVWTTTGSAGDTLWIISNADTDGTLLFIENIDTQTPTITDRSNTTNGNTGNIKTLDGNNYTFPSNKTIVLFMYSAIDGLWHQISNPSTTSSSGANTSLSNLSNVAVNTDIKMGGNKIYIDTDNDIWIGDNGSDDLVTISHDTSGLLFQQSTTYTTVAKNLSVLGTTSLNNDQIIGNVVTDYSANKIQALTTSGDDHKIGFAVSDSTFAIGSEGSIQIPYKYNNSVPSESDLDGWFGNAEGCIGLMKTSASAFLYVNTAVGWFKEELQTN